MGGWETKNETVLQTVEVSPIGAVDTALSSEWSLMSGVDTNLATSFTQSPRDVSNSGGNTAISPGGRLVAARFALNSFTVPNTKRVRFSCFVNNVATSNVTGLLVTDPDVYNAATSDPASGGFGVVYVDRNVPHVIAVWGGTTVTLAWPFFHSPGSDEFVLGLEFLGTEINAYQYHYIQPVDSTTRAQIFNDKFVFVGTIPYKLPDISNLYIGGVFGNASDESNQFLIEVLDSGGGGPPGQFHLPPLGYGLYKSQLQLHGLLNNAKMSS